MPRAWITVVAPLIASAAHTAQARYASLPPAARIRIVGVSTMPGTAIIAYCSPRLQESRWGGCSSGS